MTERAQALEAAREWQIAAYGDSPETWAALEFYRERDWPVDVNTFPERERVADRISAFKAGYRAALEAVPPPPPGGSPTTEDFTAPLPPRPPAVVKPQRYDLVRYGVTWEGQDNQPLLTPMPDGYWTPWHLAVATPVEPAGASETPSDTRRDCTCLGTCRGADGLGERYRCALEKPAPVSPVEPTPPAGDEDDDEVPAERAEGAPDAWSAPLRKPVVPKILSTDDFYALLRILEVLPADPFLSALQAKLSDEERRQHGNQASHLSGSEFVREIERVEALIQGSGPVRDCRCVQVEPTPEPPTRQTFDALVNRVMTPEARERAKALTAELLAGEPAPCVWRPIKEGSAWLKATCRDSALSFLPAKAHDFAGCPYCLKPLKVER